MAQPTRELQMAIQLLHQAMAIEPEPADKATIAQCLTALTRLQAKNLSEGAGAQGGPPQGGGYAGSPPSGPMTAADPRQALAAAFGR